MKIQFWSVGKPHEGYVKEGIEIFTRRISAYYPVDWRILPMPKNAASLSPTEIKTQDGLSILSSLKKDDHLVLLDERGRQMSSEGLAAFIQKKADSGEKNLVFLIGGAFGVSEAVFARANATWSLSQLVFPHQLVRLILAEQVYRACSINRNEKYHHI